MRVLILSQYYDPEPITKPGELARHLRDGGHDVTVLTGFPNYPSGRLYEGFRLKWRRRETDSGIPVIRAFEYPYHGTSALGRVINYVSFMLAAPVASIGAGPFDVIYVWHPPLTVGVSAWLTGLIHRCPFVYDVQDIWPDAAVWSGILEPGAVVNLLRKLETFVYARAAHVLVPTDEARQHLIGQGLADDKVSALPHWVDEAAFAQCPETARADLRATYNWNNRFVVLFTGNLGLVQGLETVIEAAAHLTRCDILIGLVGDGANRTQLMTLASELNVGDRVQFIERQPVERMPAFMAAADALLVHLRASPLSRTVIPTKTLSYLAAGRPIVMAMEGAAGDLVRRSESGVVTASGDGAALARALEQIAEMPESTRDQLGRNGRAYLKANLARAMVLPRYVDRLTQIARRTHASCAAL